MSLAPDPGTKHIVMVRIIVNRCANACQQSTEFHVSSIEELLTCNATLHLLETEPDSEQSKNV